nr:hypothetical protein [Baekduia soli]
MDAVDECPEPLAVALGESHDVRVDPRRDGDVGVPSVSRDRRQVVQQRRPQRDVRVPQRVLRQSRRQRREPRFEQRLVRELAGPAEDPGARVVPRQRPAVTGGEHEVGRRRERDARLPSEQLVTQHRQDRHRPMPGRRLRVLDVADAQPARREVDIAPPQRERLADPQPRERQRRDQRPTQARVAIPPRRRLTVHAARRVQQRDDVIRAVEMRRAPTRHLRLAVARIDPDRVAGDEAAFVGDVEDAPEPRDRRVDVGRRDHRRRRARRPRLAVLQRSAARLPLRQRRAMLRRLAQLGLPVAVDLGDGDLRQPMAREERQQVHRQLVLVRRDRVRPHLQPLRRPPLRRELVERRIRVGDVGDRRRRRLPVAALHLLQHVGQRALRVCAGHAVGLIPDVLEAAGAERPEPDPVGLAAGRGLLHDTAR